MEGYLIRPTSRHQNDHKCNWYYSCRNVCKVIHDTLKLRSRWFRWLFLLLRSKHGTNCQGIYWIFYRDNVADDFVWSPGIYEWILDLSIWCRDSIKNRGTSGNTVTPPHTMKARVQKPVGVVMHAICVWVAFGLPITAHCRTNGPYSYGVIDGI